MSGGTDAAPGSGAPGPGGPFIDLLRASIDLHPDDVATAVAETAAALGGRDVEVRLADLDQRLLRLLVPLGRPRPPDLDVEAGGAGEAYRLEHAVTSPVAGPGAVAPPSRRVWVPLIDSAHRIGVIGVTDDGSVPLEHWEALGSFVGELIVSKSAYGDTIELTRRAEPVTLAAEMRWGLLPPLTFKGPTVTVTGMLQPAHDIAGDAFDYAVRTGRASVAVLDAMGHGMEASRMANLAISAYRNGRRNGLDLRSLVEIMDEVVSDAFGRQRFVTVQIAELDTVDGTLRVASAGHPPPLHFRAGAPAVEIECAPCLPVGLGASPDDITVAQLAPGDAVVFYTDGVTEARSPAGTPFGEERLAAEVDARLGQELPAAEVLRQVAHLVLDEQDAPATDDSSMVMVLWHGPPA